MRKCIAVLLALVMCLSLCACGKEKEKENAYSAEAEAFLELLDQIDGQSDGKYPEVTLEQGADIQKLRTMYDALSEGEKESLGADTAARLQAAEAGYDMKVQSFLHEVIQLVTTDRNMLKAYNMINDAMPYLPEQTASVSDPIEVLANTEEIIQTACYPNTLFPDLRIFEPYDPANMIGFEHEETDGYDIYKYFYADQKYGKMGSEASNAFFTTYTSFLKNEYGITVQASDLDPEMQEKMENRCDWMYVLDQTGDTLYYEAGSSSILRQIGDLEWDHYYYVYIAVKHGENPPTYLTPKVSLAEKSKLVDREETSIEDMADAISGVDQIQAKPSTAQEKNALATALMYLSVMPFSHDGLVEQLIFEGFSESEAAFAADNCGADWNEQAALAAKQYLDIFQFSKEELIAQLEHDGFTHDQAAFGAK